MGQMAHLRNYTDRDDCKVVSVSEPRERTGKRVAARYGIDNWYNNATQMLEAGGLDAVVASQPFTRHGILLPRIIETGLPIFIEKPLASSVPVAERLVDLVRDHGAFVMVGYHKRCDPATIHAKSEIDRLVRTGELGKMTYVRIIMPAGDWIAHGFDHLIDEGDERSALSHDDPPEDLSETEHKRFVDFVNYYIHQINLFRHLLGESFEPVFADRSGILMIGESTSGISCTLEMSPYRTSVDWQEEALVCFERGWIRIALPPPLASNTSGTVEIYRDTGESATPILETPTLPTVHAMSQQAAIFLSAVRGDRPPMTDATEALEDLRIARAYLELQQTEE